MTGTKYTSIKLDLLQVNPGEFRGSDENVDTHVSSVSDSTIITVDNKHNSDDNSNLMDEY